MKFSNQVSFPYPVIREGSDDYIDEEFIARSVVQAGKDSVSINIEYFLSSKEILNGIEENGLSYVSIIRCRDTFFEQALLSKDKTVKVDINTSQLRGEVEISSYVFANREICITTNKLNPEYGYNSFNYSTGDIIAQSIPEVFHIDRDFFKPLQSVFQFVLVDKLKSDEWEIDFNQDKLQINASQSVFDIENSLRGINKGRSVLLNSIYFVTVMQAIQILKETQDIYQEYKWAKVFIAKIDNLQINIEQEDSYKVATKLLDYPFSRFLDLFSED
jgi:hypothetical protein